MKHIGALELPIPRNMTSLMQHLQRLVGVENNSYHLAGYCPLARLPSFVEKMEARYPIVRNARQRSYDRKLGRAAVHLIVYPDIRIHHHWSRTTGVFSLGDARARNSKIVEALGYEGSAARVAWWLVSSDGRGGLNDESMPNASEAHNAMSADEHVTYDDYVLMYANKKEPRTIVDVSKGRTKSVLKDTSSWTWKMRGSVMRELRAAIEECCINLDLGSEPTEGRRGSGLLGLLYTQRSRPLFSGVRTQVLQLERYARDEWARRAPLWRATHPGVVAKLGEHAGELRSISELLTTCMPKMVRQPVYDEPPLRIRDLLCTTT